MLFNFRRKPKMITPVVAPGQRIYAIGDVHGRADQLGALLDLIRQDADTGARPDDIQIILLGDYIDRGRDSAAVVELLSSLTLPNMQITCLRGNHEQVLLELISKPRPKALQKWLTFGGLETLASYGLPSTLLYSDDIDAIMAALETAIPDAHLDFLASLPVQRHIGDYFFVHAGVRPKRPVAGQDEQDLMWIREPFLSSDDNFGAVVVHGHSISRTVESKANRIGIDTGAYATGILTAVVLEGDQRRFIATTPRN
jgi:serine/threonine protein phosphatase 1